MGHVKRGLQSLALGKFRIINRVKHVDHDGTPGIINQDKFIFNKNFKSPSIKVKIPQIIQTKQTISPEELHNIQETIKEDRQYQIDAAIVRIMKQHESITHNKLMTELISNSKFLIVPVAIKKRIESLIDRDFIERFVDDDQVDGYKYIA